MSTSPVDRPTAGSDGPPVGSIPEISSDDDRLHPASDHWWETETAWFSFNVPERRIGGWFYNQVLATQQICNGGAWVWDDSADRVRFTRCATRACVPRRRELDLRDVQLPNGNHLQVLEPLMSYRLRYSDPGRFEADLRFDGIMAPNAHPIGVAPSGVVATSTNRCTSPARSPWTAKCSLSTACRCATGRGVPGPQGPDPRKPPPDPGAAASKPTKARRPPEGVGYPFATADERNGWLLYSRPTVVDGIASDELSTGYLLRDGVYGHLVSGRRRTWLDPADTLDPPASRSRPPTSTAETSRRSGSCVSHHGADPSPAAPACSAGRGTASTAGARTRPMRRSGILDALDLAARSI